MTEGGRLTISAENLQVSPDFAQNHKEGRPGQFLCLTVADTGCGMPPEVLSHIFEPFFTTKPVGKGTGLGLATVYGIVKQHEGWVEVQSEPGKGTTFRIFIPICNVKPKHEQALSTPEQASRGTETILVVEDETELREFVVQVLRSHGYQAIAAESGPQALERWAENRGKIDLLLTDIVMPGGLTGRQVGERLLAEDPALKVLYSSGYSVGMAGKDGPIIPNKNFLPKPYCPSKLLETLRQCLDGPAQ
jgi:two-component system cell cycle sensor histidine kinase/response regulator CckA